VFHELCRVKLKGMYEVSQALKCYRFTTRNIATDNILMIGFLVINNKIPGLNHAKNKSDTIPFMYFGISL
jgi:hypothetical protein